MNKQILRIFDYKERTEKPLEKAELSKTDFVTREEFNALSERFNSLTEAISAKGANENAESTV